MTGPTSPIIDFKCSLKWPRWGTTCSSQWQGMEPDPGFLIRQIFLGSPATQSAAKLRGGHRGVCELPLP